MDAPRTAAADALTVRETADATEFERWIAPLVSDDPVRLSVVATNVARCVAQRSVYPDALWLLVEQHGRPLAAVMHTPPHPPHLATDREDVAVAIAEHLLAAGHDVPGVSAVRPAAEAFAARWQGSRRVGVELVRAEGIYALGELVAPSGVPGAARPATTADLDLMNGWGREFALAIGDPDPGDGVVTARFRTGTFWLWEVDGAPVSMAYASTAFGGISRVSWVYTPAEHRRRGYAGAVVAAASADQVAHGHGCMLYTDLANPTSNHVYSDVGYRRIGDGLRLRFEPV